MKTVKVDAMGKSCPIPVVQTIKALEALTEEAIVETHVDNEVAVQNLIVMANGKGFKATKEELGKDHYAVKIEAGPQKAGAKSNDEIMGQMQDCGCGVSGSGKVTVALASEHMGNGDDELGKILIKSFIYTLSQEPEKVQAIIMYNSGVKLAVEGPQLEDLKALEKAGVEVICCGTCLDFYKLKEKIQVGSISNMYSIVEKLESASKIIRP